MKSIIFYIRGSKNKSQKIKNTLLNLDNANYIKKN